MWRSVQAWCVLACAGAVVAQHRIDQEPLLAPRPSHRDHLAKPDEPTCEQLKAMWRFSKRQARAPEIMNEVSSYRDPLMYNEWPVYTAVPRAAPRFRYQYPSISREAYGRVVTKAPPNVVRTPDYDEILDILTTTAGKPVNINETSALNTDLLLNTFFMDSIQSIVNERPPKREVFAKATGARGYFEVTNDVKKYTKAKLFECVGKKTPILVRLSESQSESGGSDLASTAARGFSVKFYTEEGNLDLLGINIPIYFYRDPILFKAFQHAFGRNPKTNIVNVGAILDFILKNPITLETVLFAASELGSPRGYRHMNAFPCHTFQLYNRDGKSYFVKFKIMTELGYEFFSLKEGAVITTYDPDFFIRDLFNAIEAKKYPMWRLEMDVLLNDPSVVEFDPFDVTKLWPNGTYETITIGKLILNRNIDNFYAEVEEAAYNPTNLVPGILSPLDQIYKVRAFIYNEAQIHRIGINFNKLPVNCPLYAKTYNRDGAPPTQDNEKDTPNYYPNSFNGPEPCEDDAKPKNRLKIKECNNIDFKAGKHLYNDILVTDKQKQYLVDNMVHLAIRQRKGLAEKFAELCDKVDPDLGFRLRTGFSAALHNIKMPNTIKDLNNKTLNPFGYL